MDSVDLRSICLNISSSNGTLCPQGISFPDATSFCYGVITGFAAAPFGQSACSSRVPQKLALASWCCICILLALGYFKSHSFKHARSMKLTLTRVLATCAKVLGTTFPSLFGLVVGHLNVDGNLLEVLAWIVPGLLVHKWSPELVRGNALVSITINTILFLPGLLEAGIAVWYAGDFSLLAPSNSEAWLGSANWLADHATSQAARVATTIIIILCLQRQALACYRDLALATRRYAVVFGFVPQRGDLPAEPEDLENPPNRGAEGQGGIMDDEFVPPERSAEHLEATESVGASPSTFSHNEKHVATRIPEADEEEDPQEGLYKRLYTETGMITTAGNLDRRGFRAHAILTIVEFVALFWIGLLMLWTTNRVFRTSTCLSKSVFSEFTQELLACNGTALAFGGHLYVESCATVVAVAKESSSCNFQSFLVTWACGFLCVAFAVLPVLFLPYQAVELSRLEAYERGMIGGGERSRALCSETNMSMEFKDQCRQISGVDRPREDTDAYLSTYILITTWQRFGGARSHQQ